MFLGKNPGGVGAARRSEQPAMHNGIETGGVNLMRASNDVEPLHDAKNNQIS